MEEKITQTVYLPCKTEETDRDVITREGDLDVAVIQKEMVVLTEDELDEIIDYTIESTANRARAREAYNAIKFNQWVTRSMYDFVGGGAWKHLVSGKEITGNELYEQFLKTIE